MPIQITDHEHEFIKSQLSSKLAGTKCYYFGSRVKGTAKSASDLDIAIVGDEAISLEKLSALKEAFAESNLSFKIDIVDWHRISDEFKNHIMKEWVLI